MAEIVRAVRTREIEGVDCQICGFAWKPHDLGCLPRRCANPACRSMRWDRSKYPSAAPPPPPGGPPNGGLQATLGGAIEYLPDGSVSDKNGYSVKPAERKPPTSSQSPQQAPLFDFHGAAA